MAIDKYTLKDGSTRYRAETYVHGQRVQKRGFVRKKDAQKWIDESRVHSIKGASMKFEQLAQAWLEQYRPTVRESTYTRTVTIINHAIDELGPRRLSSVTIKDAQALANKWSYEYVKFDKMITYVSAIFKYAVSLDLIQKNPFEYIKKPMPHKSGRNNELSWDIDTINRFLDICKQDKRKIRYPFFRLLIYTGMRRQEIIALKWTDIEGNLLTIERAITFNDKGQPILGDTKNKSSKRTIALDDDTLKALEDWHRFNDDQFIFPVCISRPYKWLQSIIKENDLPPATLHQMRHLHCTILINAGANIKDVQERLGHSDVETTLSIYAHANKDKNTVADLFSTTLLHNPYTDANKPHH